MTAESNLLPVSLPGHWLTEDGHAKAREYATKPREWLALAEMPDYLLANAVFMVDRDSLELGIYQTAAKERIRWLSVKLAIAEAAATELTALHTLRPISEYHEDMGPVLCHHLPIQEPPQIWSPGIDSDWGEWEEEYFTHFSPLPNCNKLATALKDAT